MAAQTHLDREGPILALWESALNCRGWRRQDALLGGADAPQSIGERNRSLLAIRNGLFGRNWPLRCDCPACGAGCSFIIDVDALSATLGAAPPGQRSSELNWNGRRLEVRAPVADDLRFLSSRDGVAAAERALLARCLSIDVDSSELSQADLAAFGHVIERLDPAAVVTFEISCPDCSHSWSAPFDIAEALWAELQRAAERLLSDVDALARTYGWTEDQIFTLPPVRRAAYLQLVAAG